MCSPPLDPPLGTPTARTAAVTAAVLAVPSVLLLLLVAFSWRPLSALDGDIARTTHRWAVDEPGVTQVFRVLTDWVWDPWTMRALGALVVLGLVWRRSAWW